MSRLQEWGAGRVALGVALFVFVLLGIYWSATLPFDPGLGPLPTTTTQHGCADPDSCAGRYDGWDPDPGEGGW